MLKLRKKPVSGVDDCDYTKDVFAVFGVAYTKIVGEGYTIVLDAVRMDGPITARVINKPKD